MINSKLLDESMMRGRPQNLQPLIYLSTPKHGTTGYYVPPNDAMQE